jgi:hypothetical protein
MEANIDNWSKLLSDIKITGSFPSLNSFVHKSYILDIHLAILIFIYLQIYFGGGLAPFSQTVGFFNIKELI